MLKLPFTHAFLERLFTNKDALKTSVYLLTERQLAAVYTILLFSQKKRENVSRLFVKSMGVVSQQEKGDVADDLYLRLSEAPISNVWEAIKPFLDSRSDDSLYLSNAHIDDRSPMLESYEHLNRYSDKSSQYTDDQARILQIIRSQSDESIDIQGFGGSGKTHLIRELCHSLTQDSLLVTAMSQAQLGALTSRIGSFQGKAQTFGSIANDVLCQNLLLRKRFDRQRTRGVKNVASEKIARALNFHNLANFSASKVVDICTQMVYNFSYSVDPKITLDHVPAYCYKLSESEKYTLVSLASLLWDEIINPSHPGLLIPQSEIHQIKYMALEGIPLPEQYRVVLCDEAHDIPPVVMQILDYSPQATLTFRDRYQAFNRNRSIKGRAQRVRSKSLVSSVRSGVEAIELCNHALSRHPYSPEEMMQATNRGNTKVIKCHQQGLPDEECAILAPNAWYVFCLAYDLWRSGSRYSFLSNSFVSTKKLMAEAIELFHGRIALTFQKDLRRATTWAQFMENSHDQVANRINEILDSGFDASQLEAVFSSHQAIGSDSSAHAGYLIGRFEDAKNMEFDKVYYYSPLAFQKANNPSQLSYMVNQTYTALTRAKHQLWIPGELEHWMKDAFN